MIYLEALKIELKTRLLAVLHKTYFPQLQNDINAVITIHLII